MLLNINGQLINTNLTLGIEMGYKNTGVSYIKIMQLNTDRLKSYLETMRHMIVPVRS